MKLNVDYEIGGYKFEWDSEKADKNYKKHNILFKVAARAFCDPNKIDDYDELHSDDEDRFKMIGKVGKILVVIYTKRGEKHRIISARLANKKERDDYYEQFAYL